MTRAAFSATCAQRLIRSLKVVQGMPALYSNCHSRSIQSQWFLFYPQIIPELHVRASAWFEKNEWLDQAIEHAFAAEDFERAGHLVEKDAQMNSLRIAQPQAYFFTYLDEGEPIYKLLKELQSHSLPQPFSGYIVRLCQAFEARMGQTV